MAPLSLSSIPLLLFAVAISLAQQQQQQQQLYLFNLTSTPEGLSTTCTSVLNQPIACDPFLLSIEQDDVESDETLASICSNRCSQGWSNYLRRVNGACGTSRYTGDDGRLYLPAVNIQPVYERWQLLCLKNSAGNFCNAVIRDILGIDPNGQTPSVATKTLAPTALCNGCFLSSLAQVLQMPMASATEYATALSSLQSSCRTTVAVTSTPSKTSWAIPAATTGSSPSTSSCKGTTYTIKPGDTCQSIAMAQGFSTTQFIEANHLTAYCRDFPTSGTLCLPDSLKCKPYPPRLGESCNTIAAANEVAFAQIVSWNPEVGDFCGNIQNLINKTMVLCISTPGGGWEDPHPVASSMTTESDTIFTEMATPMSAFPSATAFASTSIIGGDGSFSDLPLPDGTRQDCEVYIDTPIERNGSFSYACEDVAQAYQISEDQLLEWNPRINRTGGFFTPCEMPGGQQYCVQLTALIAENIAQNCSMTALAVPDRTCSWFAKYYNITEAALVAWNPSVGSGCSRFMSGLSYCVAVEHFRSPDTVSSCAYWATAEESSSGVCQMLEDKYKLQHARFVAWNPSVLSDCSGAVRGYSYCVGIPTFHPGFP